jgi:hypothetical protein
MTLDMTSGVPKIVFSRVIETERDSMINGDIEIDDKNDEEVCQNRSSVNSEFQRMMRGQSFENERGCDEIMQQFMNGLE